MMEACKALGLDNKSIRKMFNEMISQILRLTLMSASISNKIKVN